MDKFIEIKTVDDYKKAIQNKSILLFTANWCPDCMFIKPFIGEIVEQYQDYIFYSVNRDEMLELCQELDILGIPSFVAFDQGKEIGRFVSKLRKTKEEIIDFIDSLSREELTYINKITENMKLPATYITSEFEFYLKNRYEI